MFKRLETRFKTRSLALIAGASLALGALAPVAHAADDAKQSSVVATFKQMNVPVDGTFKTVDAKLHFDPANLAASNARITVKVASFDLGSPEYNKEVAGKDWFAAQEFPEATFVSKAIKMGPDARYDVEGTLTIRGKSKDVVVPMRYQAEGGAQVFNGTLSIKRLDYGIGQGDWTDTSIVADDVQLKFHIVYSGQ
ncbi:YceI family protein [Bordetella sp. N]|uniref:YceI family protein n=1 Tax=Bordetella sp. N TaxID=1746199 RepID=UPI000708B213|nr:YceI family protein [Bordetella sp. N]ALM83060.1 polyisoprenoid-binding protein [Bordetella sp. N]